MKNYELTVDELLKIKDIFEKKNWEIINEDLSHFDRYCQKIEQFKSKEQKELILELTERYLWIKSTNYITHLEIALKKLLNVKKIKKILKRNEKKEKKTKIYVTPLMTPKDFFRTKSFHYFAYLFTGNELYNKFPKINFELINLKINIIEQYLREVNEYLNKDNTIFIAVDDFIGTGDTAKKYIQTLSFCKNIENLIILTLVIQKEAIQKIKENYPKIKIFSSVIRKKGISDCYFNSELSKKISTMKQIEKKLEKLDKKFLFGYGRSESLVTMIRTPNNTFPIFWHGENPPFPR